jgi:hypothetical protein
LLEEKTFAKKYLILSYIHSAKHNLEDAITLKIFDNIKVYSYLYVSKFFRKKNQKIEIFFVKAFFRKNKARFLGIFQNKPAFYKAYFWHAY